ncbi:PucR family transcriptional regulator [Nocardia aurantiaca]|nr:helix-turn-helix domain-containing protein [Nocardia aurantiaca]
MHVLPGGDEIQATVQAVAGELVPRCPALAEDATRLITDRVGEARQPGIEDIVLATCRANTLIVLDYLARGVPLEMFTPSAEVVERTRTLVQRGLPLTAVIRGYRIGAHRLTEQWSDAVYAYGPNDRRSVEVAKAGTSYILSWLDLMTERISEEYRNEDERLARERSLSHLEDVRRVLSGPDTDVDNATNRLGYRLSGRHTAIVLRALTNDADAGASLEAAVRELGRATRTPGLTVRVDIRTMWCWLPGPAGDNPRVPPPSVPVLVAIGNPANGLDGFRHSHREALDALRVSEMTAPSTAMVTYYRDVDIAAMCSIVPERCQEFVSSELGTLTSNDRTTRRIRETLMAFYASNSNFRATAANLGIHHNTVRYRLEQAELAIGRPVGERRLALELALHLAHVIGIVDGEIPRASIR